jgi:hypothetical protein
MYVGNKAMNDLPKMKGDHIKTLLIILSSFFVFNMASAQWQWINPFPQANGLYDVKFVNQNTGFAVGDGELYYGNTAIIKTEDGGNTWTSPDVLSSCGLSSVRFSDNNNGFIVGNNGSILYTKNGGGFPVGIKTYSETSKSTKIYPNPASGNITVQTSEISSRGHLSILNVNGQELLKQTINEFKTVVDITNLNSGIYFVKVICDNTVQVEKLIKE